MINKRRRLIDRRVGTDRRKDADLYKTETEVFERLTKSETLIVTIAEDIRDIKEILSDMPCGERRAKIIEIETRLKPIEKIFWKLIIAAVSFGSFAGAIAGALSGG